MSDTKTDRLKKEITVNILPRIQGRENAMSVVMIARLSRIKAAGIYSMIGSVMKTLLVEDMIPVISNKNGFFVAVDGKEVLDYMNTLEHQIAGIESKLRILKVLLKQSM